MNKNAFLKTILLYLCTLFLNIGCNSTNMGTPTVVLRETSVSVLETPTSTSSAPTSTPTSTSSPTVLPTHTMTTTPTPLPTLTKTPIPTPLPTLSPGEAQALVVDLLQNNGWCQLPCWWGAIPGQTTWEEAELFLSGLAAEIIPLTSLVANNPLVIYEVHVKVPEQISPTHDLRLFYTVRDGMIQEIEVELGNSLNYLLPQILATYGEPSEVWLSTYSHSRDNNLPFRTVLLYLDRGFLAGYFDDADVINGKIIGCPQQSSYQFTTLWLWSSDEELSFDAMFGKTSLLDRTQQYLSLHEATEMDMKSFYETFKDSNNTTCLETSAELWPSP